MSEKKFYDQARIGFQKLDPKSGDIIAITMPEDMAHEQVLATLTYIQEVADEFGCNVIILAHGASIEAYSEEEMNKLGWYRKPKNVH